jgi:predicted RNase H-like HicB family nuclease
MIAMKEYKLEVFYSDEDEGYIANVPDLRYCSASGMTADKAVRQVIIAMDAWLEAAKTNQKPIPRASPRPKIKLPPR